MTLHRYTLTLVGTCVAEHTTHVVILHRVLQEVLSHKLGTQRVACHNHSICNLAILGADVWSRYFSCHNSKYFVNYNYFLTFKDTDNIYIIKTPAQKSCHAAKK